MAVSRRLRYEVLKRDNHACRYCGAAAPDVKLTVDHVVPVALGGKDEASNLVASCQPCNAGKSSSAPDAPLVDDVAADALRWSRARTAAIERWRDSEAERQEAIEMVGTRWDQWRYEVNGEKRTVPRDDDWERSVDRWLSEGLAADDLIALIDKAMRRKARANGEPISLDTRWSYFCGVVWGTLNDIRDATAASLNKGDSGDADDSEDLAIEAIIEEAEERGRAAGFLAAIDWAAAEQTRPRTSDPRPCVDCGERQEYEATSRCLPCWRDSLEPTVAECPSCHRLVNVQLQSCPTCHKRMPKSEGAVR